MNLVFCNSNVTFSAKHNPLLLAVLDLMRLEHTFWVTRETYFCKMLHTILYILSRNSGLTNGQQT